MQIPCSFYFSRVFLSLLPPLPALSAFLCVFLMVLATFCCHWRRIFLPLFCFRCGMFFPSVSHPSLPFRHRAYYALHIFTFLLKRRTQREWKNSAHRKNRNEIFIIRQSKVFLSAFLACCFWGAVEKFHRHASGFEEKRKNRRVGGWVGGRFSELSSQSKYAKNFSAFEFFAKVRPYGQGPKCIHGPLSITLFV